MTDELFHIDESLSPRLAWMRQHRIQTSESDLFKLTQHGKPWAAWISGKRTKAVAQYTTADTEDEAIIALAKKINLKLWNE